MAFVAPLRRQLRVVLLLLITLLPHCRALSINTTAKQIPITVLSGFLGAGKTSTLKHLLENQDGLRIAVIVNDVASVNIDSKLISSSGTGGMIEMQNGCACCSLSEELLTSVSELVTLSDLKGDDEGFHHIVVELSGVADPKSVRAKFQEAVLYDMPLMERVRLDTMVTVVDCSAFLQHIVSPKTANAKESPELFYRDKEVTQPQENWMDDLPVPLMEALLAGQAAAENSDNGVSELMVGQTETADVVLLNKIDLIETQAELEQIRQVVSVLNGKSTIMEAKYGQVDFTKVLAVAGGRGVVEAGVVDDHRDAVMAATADSHSHSHAHDCADANCSHQSHDHSHDHHNDDQHSHEHSHNHAEECTDPDCTESSHSHSHAHETHAGIGTFVYRARRPFHPKRLLSFLRQLPVKRGLPDHENDDSSVTVSQEVQRTLKKVLRSKGFTWFGDSNIAALYWSHAGASFDMQCLGRWWTTLPREQWPPEAASSVLADFDDLNHLEDQPERATVGDRRQEIVFIGRGLGQSLEQSIIQSSLDQCLLDDEEWNSFVSKRGNEDALKAAFVNPIDIRMSTY